MMILLVSGLGKRYERGGKVFSAVADISFTVSRTDFVCVTGESGSGKSTLLSILAGLLRPDEGVVRFEGKDIAELSDNERSRLRNSSIGYIPQGYSLLNNFTVLDNVCLPCCLYNASRGARKNAAKKAELALCRMGISHLAAERPQNLSGGEQRRVAIARGMVTGPALLVADEPTGDLDPKTAISILDIFAEIQRNGTAIIMVTHERERITFANRHFVMERGGLQEVFPDWLEDTEKSCVNRIRESLLGKN
ncbi:MAG: ABC transporter ATP-binding protein [Syntrophomonadaceae bacterium]|jgi:putative ABC transport system ATP-binding protein|nr:ABC transporter ATP-binding protein [Syntrophomonadaceae bacterium]